MSTDPPIQKRKLYQDVVERLMRRIESGEVCPGDQLPPERELMEQYGVGRPAIREALQAMERSGIVEMDEHTRLVDAIEALDADAAEQAMRAHLTRSNELYKRLGLAPVP